MWYVVVSLKISKLSKSMEIVEKMSWGWYLLWQYGLWSFQMWGLKLKRFLPKNQHTQRKLLNFENWVSGEVSKIGHHFSK